MNNEKILLVLLPFWSSLIPPMGISSLKSFIRPHGFRVKTVDANIEPGFREVYDNYLNTLKESVPLEKRGNFYNTAVTVLQKHLMAHLNYQDKKEYRKLMKIVVSRFFFYDIHENQVSQLTKIIAEFYTRLEPYVLDLLAREKPTILGLSVYTDTAPASLFAFQLAKKNYPHIKTVMGGGIFTEDLAIGSPNFDFFLEKTTYIDKIIVGEGELLFLKYLKGELPEKQRVYTLEDINSQTLDLNDVDIPDFSDFDLNFYPNLAAYTSRSCPFKCSFCSEGFFWGKFRKKKIPRIVKELTILYQQHQNQLFLMCDSLLNPVISELAEAFIQLEVSIYWDGYLRADKPVCNPKNTWQWRRGGFYRARLGLESGSQRLLESMGKRIMPGQIREAVTSLAYAGIKTTTYWVIGYPGETEEDFQQTLDLIEELKDDIYEADCNAFSYFLTGQVKSQAWAKNNKSHLLYPEEFKDMLLLQTWILQGEPSREETYRRMNRFSVHCKKLGIPNPYTLQEIYKADERWKRLHRNAVPSMVEFQPGKRYINENKHIKEVVLGKNINSEEAEWDF
ncbi:MAG: radical SAM protein [Candidatus Aminicenantes bacterium]